MGKINKNVWMSANIVLLIQSLIKNIFLGLKIIELHQAIEIKMVLKNSF